MRSLSPKNAALLARRDALQSQIDAWHVENPVPQPAEYSKFLHDIGYLRADASGTFQLETSGLDAEVGSIAGPQLVCPADNARFLLNAANARWGSLFDAFYGTNAVPDMPGVRGGAYDAVRGEGVHAAVHDLLDELFPLSAKGWAQVTGLQVHEGQLRASQGADAVALRDPKQFVGHNSSESESGELSLLLKKHGLHLELVVRPGDTSRHPAGLTDVRLESALSTICDLEDSACAVDADDKVVAYANWLGLMKRTLTAPLVKGGVLTERRLAPPRRWAAAGGADNDVLHLPGQALLLCRNVGMHMHTDAVMSFGRPVPEHFVDALVTATAALHDTQRHRDRMIAQRRDGNNAARPTACNSAEGSIYVVKPKMHGPEECALAVNLFATVEKVLGLPAATIKLGLMDEERRTSVNLAACMDELRERLFFVNTGFLDRTADEIHTSMAAGAVLPKAQIKAAPWYAAYESSNVRAALRAGVVGRAQIGKGMWAEPDDMAAMLASKGAQLEAGASTAWVPSPTAATLHALHYLRSSVASTHQSMLAKSEAEDADAIGAALRAGLLTPPLMGPDVQLSAAEVQAELDNNAQGLLGYVSRWVGQGVGCSKVPDLVGTQLMEDRATLRISSQHLANWLKHSVVSEHQVVETLRRVAVLVDEQNAHDADYKPMAPGFCTPEWYAALDLVFKGCETANGYTEDTLSHWRRSRKELDLALQAAHEAKLREDIDAGELNQAMREALGREAEVGQQQGAPPWVVDQAGVVSKDDLEKYRRGHSMGGNSYYSGGI